MSQPRVEVFMWEYWLNLACSSLVIANGFNKVVKQGDTETLGTPRVEFQSVFNGFGPSKQSPHMWIAGNGDKFPDTVDGRILAKVVTNRGDKAQNHAMTVGTVRGLMLTGRTAINGKLPWHTLAHLQESGSVPDFKSDENHEITTLSFDARLVTLYATRTADIFPS